NPIGAVAELRINKERAAYWLSQGAQPSDTVAGFLKKEGVSKTGVASA
ncbi:MAG: 30S ribosomal protein S16, partial [Acidithiobacillus ferriphilus]|nr:30S ribosomal protein S16 [Acidithiobacillus ferriphilus]